MSLVDFCDLTSKGYGMTLVVFYEKIMDDLLQCGRQIYLADRNTYILKIIHFVKPIFSAFYKTDN